jgi:hypothetical protein
MKVFGYSCIRVCEYAGNEANTRILEHPNTRTRLPGQALLLALLLLLVVAALAGVMLRVVAGHRDEMEIVRERGQALYLAESGWQYALQQLNFRLAENSDESEESDWLRRDLPIEEEVSVSQEGNSRFRVKVERVPLPEQATWAQEHKVAFFPLLKVTVTGFYRQQRHTLTTFVSDPTDLTTYLWNVTHFDFTRQTFDASALVEFGSEGMGVNGVIEQVATIPASGQVFAAGRADPIFAGVIPGSEYIRGGDGEVFQRTATGSGFAVVGFGGDKSPEPKTQNLKPGEYVVDYLSGTFTFSPDDVGKTVVIFHDYFRRVPLPPGPFTVLLPYPVVQEGSEAVYNLFGQRFRQDPVRPRLPNHFSMDHPRAQLFFSEHNAAQPLKVEYAFWGSRLTGPLHINGSVKWHERCLLYLPQTAGNRESEKRGNGDLPDSVVPQSGTLLRFPDSSAVTVTGHYAYAPLSHVFLTMADGRTVNLRTHSSPFYRDKAPFHLPPFLNLAFYRRLADRERGGDGLYLNNPEDKQDPTLVQAEWQGDRDAHWRGSLYDPPGAAVDISAARAPNGLIFAEGNVKVRGTLPEGQRLTIVSGGIIYVEGNLSRATGSGALALLAQDHVCLNATKFPVTGASVSPDAYVQALVFARRGALAVIPPRTSLKTPARRNQLVFVGAVTENFHYPNEQWARAFGSVEWIYDGALSDPLHRPPFLACEVDEGSDRL